MSNFTPPFNRDLYIYSLRVPEDDAKIEFSRSFTGTWKMFSKIQNVSRNFSSSANPVKFTMSTTCQNNLCRFLVLTSLKMNKLFLYLEHFLNTVKYVADNAELD